MSMTLSSITNLSMFADISIKAGTSWAAGENLGQALPGTSIGVTSSAGLGSGQGIR